MRWERPKMHSQYMREMQAPRCVACPTFSENRSTMCHFAQERAKGMLHQVWPDRWCGFSLGSVDGYVYP